MSIGIVKQTEVCGLLEDGPQTNCPLRSRDAGDLEEWRRGLGMR